VNLPQGSAEVSSRAAHFVRHMNPIALVARIWRYRDLVWQLTWREVTGRYRSSLLGFGWSFITPLVTLSAYTFVFGLVFKARWPQSTSGGLTEFGLALFAGLVAFTFFAECLTRAPGIITASPNYVKKVVFPLEVLPVSVVGSALFHAGVSAAVLVVAQQVLEGVVALRPCCCRSSSCRWCCWRWARRGFSPVSACFSATRCTRWCSCRRC
jgi:lipopolysaccharide transport system permease protein